MAADQLVSTMRRLDVRESGRRCCCNRVTEREVMSSPHLPDEVLSMVLAFMPLISILRCRLVGKRWNRLSQEALFRETYARVSGDLSLQYIHLLENSRWLAGSQVISSAGGLVLVTSFAEKSVQLYVINPMTATLKQIPPMLGPGISFKHDFSVVGMIMNSETDVYKILAAQEGVRPVRWQVYDSSCGGWQGTGTWTVRQPWGWRDPASNLITYIHEECFNANPVSFHALHLTLHDGALHCLSVEAARHFRVLRFDPGSNRCAELPGLFPPPPSSFLCDFRCKPVLFENKGRLMLAGAQVTGPTSIKVTMWQYNGEDAEWMQVASTQLQMEGEDPDICAASYSENSFFYLDACEDRLCLGAYPSCSDPDPKVAIYSILQDSWSLTEQEADKNVLYWQNRAFFYEPRSAV